MLIMPKYKKYYPILLNTITALLLCLFSANSLLLANQNTLAPQGGNPQVYAAMKEMMEEQYQARGEKADVTIANNGSNDLTRKGHDLYHGNLSQQMSKIGARLKKEAKKYGVELRNYPHRNNVWHYDIRQAVQEIMNITRADKVVLDNIDGKSVTIWIEAGILIIKDPNFSVNHAGRNEMAVYARDDRGVAHEKTELGLWIDFAFNPGKYGAYNMQILNHGSTMEPEEAWMVLIGDAIMEWANRTVENRMPVNNRPFAESLRRRFHQMACQIEFNHILGTKVENAEIGIGTAGLAYEKIPLRAIEYMMNKGMDITVVENGADSLEPDLLTLAPLENRLIVSEQCLKAHSPQWFEYRILTYIHYLKLIGAGRTIDEKLAGEAQAESRALFDIYLRCKNGERFAPDIMIDLRRFGNDITHAWTLRQELDLFNSVKQRFRNRLSRAERRILDGIPDEYIFDMAHNIIGNDLDERLVAEEERQETNLYDDVFDPFIASEILLENDSIKMAVIRSQLGAMRDSGEWDRMTLSQRLTWAGDQRDAAILDYGDWMTLLKLAGLDFGDSSRKINDPRDAVEVYMVGRNGRIIQAPSRQAGKPGAALPRYLKTYGLCDCIAFSLYDPVKRVGMMVHFVTTDSVDEVLTAKLGEMQANYGSRAADLEASLVGGWADASDHIAIQILKFTETRGIRIKLLKALDMYPVPLEGYYPYVEGTNAIALDTETGSLAWMINLIKPDSGKNRQQEPVQITPKAAAADLTAPANVLILCNANRERSPIAEHIMKSDMPPDLMHRLNIVSAGLMAAPDPTLSEERLLRRNTVTSRHIPLKVTEEQLRKADIIFVMTAVQRTTLEERYGFTKGKVFLLLDDRDLHVNIEKDYPQTGATYGALYRTIKKAMPHVYERIRKIIGASHIVPTASIQAEIAKIHNENLNRSPAIPDKTIICHIITDSILPAGQRNMLKILEQDMRNDKYSEKVVSLSNTDPENSEDFMVKLEAIKAREELRYPGYKIRFDVACPKQNLVGIIQSKGMQALAFSAEGEGDIAQIEGIILALRALQTGNINDLLGVYKLLTNKDAAAVTSDINELARTMLFVLPLRKADVDKIGILNKIMEENIKTAA